MTKLSHSAEPVDNVGWLSPSGVFYIKTMYVRTHEHLAELIVEKLHTDQRLSHMDYENYTDYGLRVWDLMIGELGYCRIDSEESMAPPANRITSQQMTFMARMKKHYGYCHNVSIWYSEEEERK